MKRLFTLCMIGTIMLMLCCGCGSNDNTESSDAVSNESVTETGAKEDGTEVVSTESTDDSADEAIIGFEVAVDAQYDFAGEYHEGFAKVGTLSESEEMKYFFIDTEGTAISGKYDLVTNFSEGMAAVANRTEAGRYLFGYIDTTGEEVIPLQFEVSDEGMCYAFYEGMAVVEDIKYEEDWFAAVSYLIDTEGNPVTEYTEAQITGYGGYGMDDVRVLSFVPSESKYDTYVGTSDLQAARVLDRFPMEVFDLNTKRTYTLDEQFNVLKQCEGKILSNGENYRIVNKMYPKEFVTACVLTDLDGNELTDAYDWINPMKEGYLVAEWYDEEKEIYCNRLMDSSGTLLSDIYEEVNVWEAGFLFKEYDGNYMVVDNELNELFTVQADTFYQDADYRLDENGNGYKIYAPLFTCSYAVEKDGMYYYCTEYYSIDGEVAIPYDERGNYTFRLNNDFYIRNFDNFEGKSYCSEIYHIPSGVILETEDFYRVERAQFSLGLHYDEDMITFYTSSDSTEPELARLTTENGMPVFTPVLEAAESSEGSSEEVLLENEQSAVWGVWYAEEPVRLTIGDKEVGQFAGASTVYKNIYKAAENCDFANYRAENFYIGDVDGKVLTDIYENIGLIREGYVSYCKDGKWGYLKAVTAHG